MLGGDLTAGSGSGSMPEASSPPMLTRLTPKTIFLDSSEKVQYVMHTHVCHMYIELMQRIIFSLVYTCLH